MNLGKKLFGRMPRRNRLSAPEAEFSSMRGYMICTAPRSGSNFLGQLLDSTGSLGKPLEYFNASGRRKMESPDFPDDIAGQLRRIMTQGSTANGIYAVKAFASQYRKASRDADLMACLPNLSFVELRREDLLAQAISWSIARQTGQYRATRERKADPVYDARLIENRLRALIREYAAWDHFFARTGIARVALTYETVCADPSGAVNAIARALGIGPVALANTGAVDIRIQRSGLNEEWRKRFLDDTAGRYRGSVPVSFPF